MDNQRIARELVAVARELTAANDFKREVEQNIQRIKKTISMQKTHGWPDGYARNLKKQLKFYEGELRKLK